MIKVLVKNFGAIKEGEFEIKPLSIFIGDNNSGKSFIAKLVYSVLKCLNEPSFIFNYYDYHKTIFKKTIDDFLEDSKKQNFFKSIKTIKFDEETRRIFFKNFEENIRNKIIKVLEVYFNDSFKNLININYNFAMITIKFDFLSMEVKIYQDKIDIQLNNRLEESVKIENLMIELNNNNSNNKTISYNYKRIDNYIVMPIITFTNLNENIIGLYNLLDSVYRLYLSTILSLQNIDYFPASKTVLISNFNTFDMTKTYKHNMYIQGDLKEPLQKDNFINQDFLHLLHSLKQEFIGQKENTLESFKYLQNSFEGDITIDSNKNIHYQISNNKNTLSIPIDETSTKITELTPLYLYLKKYIKSDDKNNLLILEEPEAHLNPKMQRVIARLLVMMANEGINLIITTHSDYILDEINILLKLQHIKEIDENKFNEMIKNDKEYKALMALDKENINIYRFIKKNLFSTTIEKLKVTKNKVDEKEFIETTENLYNKNCEVIEILKDL